MNHFNIFLLILATVFLISEIVFAAPKRVNYHDWRMKSCDSRKLMRMGFDLVEYYNYHHHTTVYFRQILKAQSKNNGTKYYDVYFVAIRDCNKKKDGCPVRLHAFVTSFLDRKQKPIITINEENSKAE